MLWALRPLDDLFEDYRLIELLVPRAVQERHMPRCGSAARPCGGCGACLGGSDFTAAGAIDQFVAMRIAIAARKIASVAVIVQSGLTACLEPAVTAGDAPCRREEGVGAFMVSLLVIAVLVA
jgi:hypothetical protein